eukprot:SAG31_NODE_3370_length_4353_cov_5.039962_6_plen_152_part_00
MNVFARRPPNMINTENFDEETLKEWQEMWGMQDDSLPMALDRPYSLITLRQCWQLGVDCGIVNHVLQRADLSRLFLYSSREKGDSTTDGIEISNCDEENPHHPNNELHIYEFIEWIIRCADSFYEGSTAGPTATVHSRFKRLYARRHSILL